MMREKFKNNFSKFVEEKAIPTGSALISMGIMMREKFKNNFSKFVEEKAIPTGSALISMGIMMSSTLVYADAASSLMETIIGILCKLVIVLGAVFALMGVIHYTSANSEGDGPAKQKAMMQIASGVMLVVLSAVLDSQKDAFVSIITS